MIHHRLGGHGSHGAVLGNFGDLTARNDEHGIPDVDGHLIALVGENPADDSGLVFQLNGVGPDE